jgi:hypothetical protein
MGLKRFDSCSGHEKKRSLLVVFFNFLRSRFSFLLSSAPLGPLRISSDSVPNRLYLTRHPEGIEKASRTQPEEMDSHPTRSRSPSQE